MPIVRAGAARQRGVVLFISLIVLVAMTLAGLATVRSVDTGVMIAGNLAFKQAATASADNTIEATIDWVSLPGVKGTLNSDNPAAGYFANWGSADGSFDAAGVSVAPFDWANNSVSMGTDAAGNTVRYVIHRMCILSGITPNGSQCVMTGQGTLARSSFGAIDYSRQPLMSQPFVYYRVTARVQGPRNTLSYVQTFVH